MTNATFFNWTDEAFTGYWNGKPRTFVPGAREYMPGWLAEHFAKHLTNRELIKEKKVTSTSPKFPEQVPEFMELFNKAYIGDPSSKGDSELDGIVSSAKLDEPSMNIAPAPSKPIDEGSPAAVQARQQENAAANAPTGEGATIIAGPDDGDEGDYQVPTTAPAAS